MATSQQIINLFDDLKLGKSFEDLEYGGIIQSAILTLRLPVTVESKKVLDNIFWGNADPYINIYSQRINPNDSTVANYYSIPEASLTNLSGQRLQELVSKCMDIVVDIDKNPCPYDQLLIIIIIVVSTIVAISTAGSTLAQSAALIAGLLSFGITVGIISHPNDVKNAQIAIAILSLGSGIDALTSSKTVGIAEAANFALQVANTTLQAITIEDTYNTAMELDTLAKETDEFQDKLEAEVFEQKLNYVYSESYDATYRDGHEKDPYDYVRKLYSYLD